MKYIEWHVLCKIFIFGMLMADDMCMVYHLVKFSSITSIPNNEVVQNSSDE